ncbi:class I SAM-dependent methyltransferase [Brevibacillus invocatus]|uniref:class I SAM-dependent methyltransferase n=1 Tax=Brevibacillus invocatus TaxID=173959 RepID=UPI002040B524|nr:class I SAM-dependent methyltransferase [Brevibacillus invocatus]MCM3079665.1 class I SAM-dependent methyltransferase [Brevibacillus invocatus]MCM3431125.1 class I SAM-dependent methyltransferase [Brevibacillus invocatus]
MNIRDKNIGIWENIYANMNRGMTYPNDVLVRIGHRFLDKQKHKTLLEYGFGGGADLLHFHRNGFEVSGAEVSQSAIDALQEKLDALGASADLRLVKDRKIPFEDEAFDVVIAWHVLTYNNWTDLEFAVSEIDRVLKPGGKFIGTIGAVGDYSHFHSVALGDHLYESKVPGQEGAVVIMVDEEQLQRCFPGKKLTTGELSYSFDTFFAKHWIVSYEKGASHE